MKVQKITKFWLPVILWAGVIFTFSAFTTVKTSEIYWQDFIVKKLAHIAEYAIFAVLFYRALVNSGAEKKKAGYLAIVSALVYGITDEFHQSFTPGREPMVRDVIIDTIGGSIGIWALWNLLPKAPEKIKVLVQKLSL
jgi:VanZ family protein